MPHTQTIVTRRARESADRHAQSQNAGYSGIRGKAFDAVRHHVLHADANDRKRHGFRHRDRREFAGLAKRILLWRASNKALFSYQIYGYTGANPTHSSFVNPRCIARREDSRSFHLLFHRLLEAPSDGRNGCGRMDVRIYFQFIEIQVLRTCRASP